jgi:hypothetical protein
VSRAVATKAKVMLLFLSFLVVLVEFDEDGGFETIVTMIWSRISLDQLLSSVKWVTEYYIVVSIPKTTRAA